MNLSIKKKYTLWYVAALTLIAVVSLLSHLLLNMTLAREQGFAQYINISGRQRMFSQRIVSLAQQYQSGDQTAKNKILQALQSFKQTQTTLVQFVHQQNSDSAPMRALRELYSDSNDSLQHDANLFTINVSNLLSHNTDSPEYRQTLSQLIIVANTPLLNKLDLSVKYLQKESERRLTFSIEAQWWLLGIIILILILEAVFVFNRMLKQLLLLITKNEHYYDSEISNLSRIKTLTEEKASITEKFEQATKQQAQKTESNDKSAADIANEFNNLLADIQASGKLLSKDLQNQPQQLKNIQNIMSTTQTASQLTQQLLNITRKKK
ncbi:MAG: type IV pili methyl-accepting chemotaxis transducer N-terminal domain-containing protein [Coxiellaceae bacterium]|nr:type IV pili methyl-accepting chemotaxis transducer N-terminal domain-containing protein [Coxiellaceae bacterium]